MDFVDFFIMAKRKKITQIPNKLWYKQLSFFSPTLQQISKIYIFLFLFFSTNLKKLNKNSIPKGLKVTFQIFLYRHVCTLKINSFLNVKKYKILKKICLHNLLKTKILLINYLDNFI